MAEALVVDKENLTPSGTLAGSLGKRPATWGDSNDENAKRKALLRPSTRFTNAKDDTGNTQQPSKPAAMGPPPPRVAVLNSDSSSALRPKLVAPEQRKATVVSSHGCLTFKNDHSAHAATILRL